MRAPSSFSKCENRVSIEKREKKKREQSYKSANHTSREREGELDVKALL